MRNLIHSFLQLFYPHQCLGCGSDFLRLSHLLCSRCIHQLPETGFFEKAGNPVEKAFYGRLRVEKAAALYYFTKNSLVQGLMLQLKYRGNRNAGLFLGRMMGHAILSSGRFTDIDLLVPLPLNAKKQFKRGYNQAELICKGISEVCGIPLEVNTVVRKQFTESQTTQNRVARWLNMEGVFEVRFPDKLINKHILLVDDVMTTGATLEACGSYILSVPGVRLSIATAAYTI
ncbi:ComF family protein [Sediminibacterium sp.]|jgi:ComF family protein|uniref:ComF family protein n=1 Tax=Sediminibacterium sp. TaxID=1917865 RepID=UPI0025E36506|nr:ComF family protein [Sediminibacterium sp.]MBW0178922.1 ComF family protein [Sediminibacterium sp.]